MATAKSMASEQVDQANDALNFDMELKGLQEAEACMDRLLEKRRQLNEQSLYTEPDRILLAHMELLAERSKTENPANAGELTAVMILIRDSLVGV